MIYDFIIIGAGISGLYTYYLLHKHNPNYKILILESRFQAGGRIMNDGKSELGAKFLHNNINKFIDKYKEELNTYYVGNLEGKNKTIQDSMKLEDSGSISNIMHPKFAYNNEINIEYDFRSLVKKYTNHKNILFNTPFISCVINKEGFIVINKKYITKKLIFTLPVNSMKEIKNPFKKCFNNLYQSNIITLSFELNKNDNQFKSGFFFEKNFKRTSFFYDNKKYILYVNIFDRNKNFSIDNMVKKICNNFMLDSYKLKKINWKTNKNFNGGWSIPKKTLSTKIIEIIEQGYKNKIYFTGDYLGKIENMGTATSAIKNSENIVKYII